MRKPAPDLSTCIGDLKARCRRVAWGRIYLEVHMLDGQVAYHRIREDRLTEEEVERLMREKAGVRL